LRGALEWCDMPLAEVFGGRVALPAICAIFTADSWANVPRYWNRHRSHPPKSSVVVAGCGAREIGLVGFVDIAHSVAAIWGLRRKAGRGAVFYDGQQQIFPRWSCI